MLGIINDVLNFAGQGLLISGLVVNSQGNSILDNPDVKFLINNSQVTNGDFGILTSSEVKQLVVYAKNFGANTSDNSVASLLSGSNFQIVFNQCSQSLAPNNNCQIRILFSSFGKADGIYNDTLNFAGISLPISAQIGVMSVADIESDSIQNITIPSSDVWTDIPGATLTINPTLNNEKWEITYQGTIDVAGENSNPIFAGIRIVDSNNNEIDKSTVILATIAEGYFYPNGRIIKLTARDTLSVSKTYKLQLRKGSNGQFVQLFKGDYTGALSNPDISQKMYAVKVPDNSSYINSLDFFTLVNPSNNVWYTVSTVDITPSSLNEKVEINFRGSLTLNLIANQTGYANLRIVDGSDNLIDNSIVLMAESQGSSYSAAVPVHLTARDTVSAFKTYKLQMRKYNGNFVGVYTGSYTPELVDPDVKGSFYIQKFPSSPAYIESTPILNTEASAPNEWIDVVGSQISINPTSSNEKWELKFQGSLAMSYVLGGNTTSLGNIRIVDSDNNEIDNSTMALIARSSFGGATIQPINLVARTVVSSPKTYKLQIRNANIVHKARIIGDVNNNFVNVLTNPDFFNRFFALKY
jgi:hypothetical protein